MQLSIKLMVLTMIAVLLFSSYAYYLNGTDNAYVRSNDMNVSDYNITSVNYNKADNIIIVNYSGLSFSIFRSMDLKFHKMGNYLIVSGLSNSEFSELAGILKSFDIGYISMPQNLTATPYIDAVPMQQSNALVYYPNQIYQAYSYIPAFSSGLTGKGETIGIVDAFGDPNLNYDIFAFDHMTGLPPVNLSVIYLNFTGFNVDEHWVEETSLDVEWAHVSAPDARIVLVIANNDTVSSLTSALNYMINNVKPNVISLSWGIAESQVPKSDIIAMDSIYQEASQQGITIVAASGDNGAYDGTSNLTVNFPASSPYVLSVGGVSLFAFNGKFSESAWGGMSSGKSYGSGGGYSSVFMRPVWQDPPNYSSPYRGVPDVSMIANPNTGVLMISDARAYDAGGTSLAAPLWAGIVALMDQASNRSLGLVNPLLYQISNTKLYTNAFTQVTSGSNGYYSAGPGWNPVTGLGTPIVSNLLNDSLATMEPYGSMYLFNASVSSVSAEFSVSDGNSTYPYVGFYYNASNYIFAGVMNDTNRSYIALMTAENGISYEANAAPIKTGSVFVGLYANSFNNITIQYGNRNFTYHMFFANLGIMRPVTGVEMVGAMDNLSAPRIFIDHLMIDGRGYGNFSAVQLRYSGIGSSYDSLSIAIEKNGSLMAERSYSYVHNVIEGSIHRPFIEYRLAMALPAKLYLSLNNSAQTQFYLDGKEVSMPFTTYGAMNLEFNTTYDGTNITANISIPGMSGLTLIFKPVYGYSPATVLIKYDHFYSAAVKNNSQIPVVQGNLTFILSSNSFYSLTETRDIVKNTTINETMYPINADVILDIYPAPQNVALSNYPLRMIDGHYTGSFHPGTYELNVSKPGFNNYSANVSLSPGEEYLDQIDLVPTIPMIRISGNVSDGLFKFPIPGVLVKTNSTFAYTNRSGGYTVFSDTRTGNVTYSYPIYSTAVMNYSGDPSETLYLNVDLYPLNVSALSLFTPKILNVFPFLFYVTYISWNTYTGPDFGTYEILISTSRSMANPEKLLISQQTQNSLFILGTTPGHSYYIQEVLMLNNGQFFQSQVTVMSYSNPVYLGLNLVIVAAILIYVYFAISIFMRRRR